MKKIVIGILSLLLVFLSVGCYGNSYSRELLNNSTISESEFDSFFDYPSDYIGREITISGVVLGEPNYKNGRTYFKIKAEGAVHSKTLSIVYNGWVDKEDYSELTEGDNVEVMGYVSEKGELYSNPTPLIRAYNVTESLVDASEKEIIINEKQEQEGTSITLEKVVFSKNGVKAYISATNASPFPIYLKDSNVNFIQNSISHRNENSEYLYNQDILYLYLEPNQTMSGATTSEFISEGDFQLVITPLSNDPNSKMVPFLFNIKAGE